MPVPLDVVIAGMLIAFVLGVAGGALLRRPRRALRWPDGSAWRSYSRISDLPIDWSKMQSRGR